MKFVLFPLRPLLFFIMVFLGEGVEDYLLGESYPVDCPKYEFINGLLEPYFSVRYDNCVKIIVHHGNEIYGVILKINGRRNTEKEFEEFEESMKNYLGLMNYYNLLK